MSKRFSRQDGMRHIRLGSKKKIRTWRHPRGTHSKMRRRRKSYPATPSIGYRTPRKERQMPGALPVILSLRDIARLTKGTEALIASRVGARKRIELVKQAREKGIKLRNIPGAA